MDFELQQALMILVRTPATLRGLLQDLSEDWTAGNEGPDTWSPFDTLGHLIQGEQSDWIARAQIILSEGESRAFDPFDRFAQLKANQGKSLGELLRTFTDLREKNLETLKGLDLKPEDLDRKGRHPELGTVTLRQLLATWVVHDLGHLAQICRVLAKQYADQVGPWGEFLPVLRP